MHDAQAGRLSVSPPHIPAGGFVPDAPAVPGAPAAPGFVVPVRYGLHAAFVAHGAPHAPLHWQVARSS